MITTLIFINYVFHDSISWSPRKVILNDALCFLKKCKKRSWMLSNRNFSGMLKVLQEMMALPAKSLYGIFPSQAALKQSLNVLICHPDHEDFPLTDKPVSQHLHTSLWVPVCRCRGAKPWGPEQILMWLINSFSNKNIVGISKPAKYQQLAKKANRSNVTDFYLEGCEKDCIVPQDSFTLALLQKSSCLFSSKVLLFKSLKS